MDKNQVALVQKSFEKAAALGGQVAEIFYGELFAIEPALRAMFKGDMKEQGKKLLTTLAFVVRSLHAPEKIIKPAQDLAVKHLAYGVKEEHYALVGNALLRTLKKGLGDQYTSDVHDAWVAAYKTLSGVMKDAAYHGTKAKGAA